MHIAVIGGGLAGLCAAQALARAGHRVDIYEQFELGHQRGSSHGRSRIYRHTYADARYTTLMAETLPLWHELERACGQRLLVPTGLVLVGEPQAPWMVAAHAALENHGVEFESWDATSTWQRGGLRLSPLEWAIHEPGAGYLLAGQVLQNCLGLARQHGARWLSGRAVHVDASGLVDGQRYDVNLICTGAWFAEVSGCTPTLQHYAYFRGGNATPAKVWVEACEPHYYGVPDFGHGAKIGIHQFGRTIDPRQEQHPDPQTVEQLVTRAKLRLGADAELLRCGTCLYSVTPDENFRFGQQPGPIPTFWASACSGHGFKFGIWVGQTLAALAQQRMQLADLPVWLR